MRSPFQLTHFFRTVFDTRSCHSPLVTDILLLVGNNAVDNPDRIIYVAALIPTQKPSCIPYSRSRLMLPCRERVVGIPEVASCRIPDLIKIAHGLVEYLIDIPCRRVTDCREGGDSAHGDCSDWKGTRPEHLDRPSLYCEVRSGCSAAERRVILKVARGTL